MIHWECWHQCLIWTTYASSSTKRSNELIETSCVDKETNLKLPINLSILNFGVIDPPPRMRFLWMYANVKTFSISEWWSRCTRKNNLKKENRYCYLSLFCGCCCTTRVSLLEHDNRGLGLKRNEEYFVFKNIFEC